MGMSRERIEQFITGAVRAYEDHMGKEDPLPALVETIADMWQHDAAQQDVEEEPDGNERPEGCICAYFRNRVRIATDSQCIVHGEPPATDDAPEAPVHLDAAEAAAWQLGWSAGRDGR